MKNKKEKKPREPWRVNKVAYIIAILWASVCFIMMMIGCNAWGFTGGVCFVFIVIGALPILAIVIIESKKRKKFEKEEAEKAAEIRRRYDERQQQEREERILAEERHEAEAIYRTTARVKGVTFKNEEGISRQSVLKGMYSTNEITVEKYLYKGKEPAARLIDNVSEQEFGNLSAEMVADFARKYPQTRWEAKIHDLSTFQPDYDDKEIYTCKVDIFIYKDSDGNEIF